MPVVLHKFDPHLINSVLNGKRLNRSNPKYKYLLLRSLAWSLLLMEVFKVWEYWSIVYLNSKSSIHTLNIFMQVTYLKVKYTHNVAYLLTRKHCNPNPQFHPLPLFLPPPHFYSFNSFPSSPFFLSLPLFLSLPPPLSNPTRSPAHPIGKITHNVVWLLSRCTLLYSLKPVLRVLLYTIHQHHPNP